MLILLLDTVNMWLLICLSRTKHQFSTTIQGPRISHAGKGEKTMAKKIINGLRYDSEKAIEVGSDSYSHRGDFSFWEETLYKTPRAHRFFLVGEGGPMTRYAKSVGQNEWTGSSDLMPMDNAAAMRWCEKHLGAGDWEKYFEDQIEEA